MPSCRNTATVSFKTIGCRLNQAETAAIAARFEAAGYSAVPFGHECDVCVVNTCVVTHRAEADSIRCARRAKRTNAACVAVTGCAVQVRGPEFLKAAGADLLVERNQQSALPFPLLCDAPAAAAPMLTPRFETTRALVKAQDGCDFHCAYCVVPAARGAPVSRRLDEITDEVRRLAQAGFQEVVLTGANLGCWRNGHRRLPDLLSAIESISGIERIRLSSIEISTCERAVVDMIAASAKFCKALHVPLQSGDDRILAAMGRKYTARRFREFVECAVSKITPLGLGTDVIVGFPGEDDTAFEATFNLVSELPFANLHVFPYSRRPFTAASMMKEQVGEKTKKERVRRMLSLAARKEEAFARSFVGRRVFVLIERLDGRARGSGWTGEYVRALVRHPHAAANRIFAGKVTSFENGNLIITAQAVVPATHAPPPDATAPHALRDI